jgi:hypothetical protein
MADTVHVPGPAAPPSTAERRAVPAEAGGWALLLVPTGICLMMFVVAALW